MPPAPLPKVGFCRRFFVLVAAVAAALTASPGQTIRAQAGQVGQWRTLPALMPINPVHVALMNTGRVLVVSGSGNVATETNFRAAVWDPLTDTLAIQPLTWDMFCNGMSVLPDGRVFVNGGNLEYDPFLGERRNAAFDPVTETFTDLANMAHGRWYPTVTTLGDGRVMTFSGLLETGGTNSTVEIYTPGVGWSQEYPAGWTPPLYPRMHLLSNGNVFYAGSGRGSRIFNTATRTWSSVVATTNHLVNRTYGTSVLLPLTPGDGYKSRVMIFGGGNPGTNTTEIIDLSVATPSWQYGPPMSQPRIELNATLLPSGKVLVVGGSRNDEDAATASLNADLYDPRTNTFSSAGANRFPRLYHSNALLLPDATVLVNGGNPQRGNYEQRQEIYSPAYLFDANGNPALRPVISDMSPGTLRYGRTFQVATANPADIGSVVLIRPGAPTHAFDMEQRFVGLSYTAGAGVLNVVAPPNGNVAPPGYYMLFILDSAGVPSVARFVHLSASPNQAPTAVINSPTGTVTINPGESVAFSGSGNDTDGTVASYAWTFPGGSPASSALQTPGSVTYAAAGSFVASLVVTDDEGLASAPVTRTINVGGVAPPQPLTFGQSQGVSSDASGTTLAAQLTAVTPGSLIVAYVKWEGTAAGTVTLSDGVSAFTADALNSAANGDLHGRFYYLPASSASGTVTYTATWSAAKPYRRLLVYRYTYGGTVSFDGSTRATAATGSLNSGAITTTGSDEVVFGAYGEYGANDTTNERVNNLVADRVVRSGFASMWSKTLNAPATGNATAAGNSVPWIGNIIAFKRAVVTGPNTPPTITSLGSQTIDEDTGTGARALTVGDAETAPGSLTLSGSSSNATLVPPGNIAFGGSGANRTVTVTPAPNQSGTATVTVTVSDGQATASTSFLLTVTAVNDVPTISSPGNQATSPGVAVGPIPVTVGDVETPAGNLTLTGATSNSALVPVGNIVFSGAGSARTVTVTPVPGQTGTATITMTVGDGAATASASFLLTVSATPPQPLTFGQSQGVSTDASGTTLAVQLTGVTPGSLIVAYVKWEGAAAGTVTLSDGVSAFTADTLNSAANGDLHGRFYYLLASSASGTVTYTATWSAARPYRKLLVYRYTYGGSVSFDGSNRATAGSGSLNTGAVTTTGSNDVVFGAYGEYATNTTTNEQVNGVAADQVLRTGFASMWSKTFTVPFTGSATATGNSLPWIGNIIAFRRTP